MVSDVIRMIQGRFDKEGIKLAAIPKAIEIGREDDGNGKIPYLVSETSVHRGAGSVLKIPKTD